MKKAVEAKAEKIIKSIITPGMRDYEKELKIYDYIINNTRYDNEAVGKLRDTAHSDYGVLILGKGVCEGYSRAAYRLLNMAGVKNTLISGYANGIAHQWNIVYIDGKPYHIDATWDDPTTSDGSNILRHDHFNITDTVMRATHTWDAKGYTVCNSTDYSYAKVVDYTKNNNAPAPAPIVTPEPKPVLQPTPVPTSTPAPAAIGSTKAGATTLTIKVTKKNGAGSGVLWYKDKPVDGLIFIIKKLE